MSTDSDGTVTEWKRLCGLAVQLCGSQEAFRKEAQILKRLVKRFGYRDVEYMVSGAQILGWHSLRGLGSQSGLGRHWAIAAYWNRQKGTPWTKPERLKKVLWDVVNERA